MSYNPWKEAPFEAKKEFTDRESFRKILQDAVFEPQQPDQHKMLVIYGAGGQGKSALKENFVKWLDKVAESDRSLVHVHLDFEYVKRNRQVDDALLSMAEQLIERYKIALPCFSFGILRYKKMVYPEKNLESVYPFLFKVKGLNSDIYQEIIGLAADASGILGIGFLLKKGTSKLLEWLKRRDVNRLIGNLDELSDSQLLEQLPYLLAFDVYQEMERSSKEGLNKRFVFVMDGYESLWKLEANWKADKDDWIRKLVLSLQGVLFIAFGRDRLRWAETENDPYFNTFIQQFLLTGLMDSDADHYLQQVPITEKEIRKVIISSSKSKAKPEEGCLPFYLSLQVDTYERIRNQDKPVRVEDFGGTEQKIINHFFEHINIIIANAIQVLSIPNIIDEEIIEELISKNYISPSAVSITELKNYSFIYSDSQVLTMHSLMREMCRKQIQQDAALRYQHIQEALFNYFDNKLPVLPEDNGWRRATAEWELILEQAAYHKAIFDSAHFGEWILEETNDVHTANAWKAVPNILERAAALSNSQLEQARIFTRLADCYGHIHNYEKKKEYLGKSIALFESMLSTETLAVLADEHADEEFKKEIRQVIVEVGSCYMAIAEASVNNNKLLDADEEYSVAKKWAKEHQLFFDDYKYALFMMRVGRVADSEPVLFQHYCNYREEGDTWSQSIVAHDLSKLLSRQGRHDEAKKFSSEAGRIVRSIKGDDAVDVAIVTLKMAEILIREGLFLEEAKAMIATGEKLYTTIFGEDNWHLYQVYAAYGDLYSLENEADRSLEMYNKALAFLRRSPNNQDFEEYDVLIDRVAIVFKHFTNSGKYQAEYEAYSLKFLSLMENDFPLVKNCMGIHNPSLRQGMELYIALNDYIGNVKESDRMRMLQQEFNRVLKHQGHVRLDGLKCSILPDGERKAFLEYVKDLTSLPEDLTKLEVTRIDLPFYKTYVLYQVRYENVEPWYAKYVLTNGENFYVFNRKNEFIYKANEEDLSLDKDTLPLYTRFFFDMVSGEKGSFYPFESADQVPWRLDKELPEGLPDYLKDLIQPFSCHENDEECSTRSWIVFQEDVFRSDVEVNKKNGYVVLSNAQLLEVYRDAEGNYQHNIVGESAEPLKEKDLLSPLPIGVTPKYDHYSRSGLDKPYILEERIEVRTNEFEQVPVEEERLPGLYHKLRTLTVLPEDMTGVEVQEYILPFYRTVRLFKVIQTTTQTPVYHYFIGNDDEMEAFSWTNKFIYQLGVSELVLNDENTIPYVKFFFDSVMGRHGRFFILNGPEEIPWTERAIPEGALEKCIAETISRIKQVKKDHDLIVFEVHIVFRNSLFKSEIHVNPQNGIMSVVNEHHIVFLSDEKGVYTSFDRDEVDDMTPNYIEMLPISADPVVPFKQEITEILRIIKAAQLFGQVTGAAIKEHDLASLSASIAQNGIVAENKETTVKVLKEYKEQLNEKLPTYLKLFGEADEFIIDLRTQMVKADELTVRSELN